MIPVTVVFGTPPYGISVQRDDYSVSQRGYYHESESDLWVLSFIDFDVSQRFRSMSYSCGMLAS